MKRFLIIPFLTLLMWTPAAFTTEQVSTEFDDEDVFSALGEICIVCWRDNWDPKYKAFRTIAHIDLTDLAARRLKENGPNGDGWSGTSPSTCKHFKYSPGSEEEKFCQAGDLVEVDYTGSNER